MVYPGYRIRIVRHILWVNHCFKLLFGEESTTFKYKWLRAMHSEGFTGVHVDWVYMGRGSRNLLTCWIPLGFDADHMRNYLRLLNKWVNTLQRLSLLKRWYSNWNGNTCGSWRFKQSTGIWRNKKDVWTNGCRSY